MQHAPLEHASFVDRGITTLVPGNGGGSWHMPATTEIRSGRGGANLTRRRNVFIALLRRRDVFRYNLQVRKRACRSSRRNLAHRDPRTCSSAEGTSPPRGGVFEGRGYPLFRKASLASAAIRKRVCLTRPQRWLRCQVIQKRRR